MKLLLTLAATTLLFAGCSASDYSIGFVNETRAEVELYSIETSPPPPRRVASGTLVAPGTRFAVDTESFNPVFYDPQSKLGLILQMDFASDPPMILTRVMQYQVAPGTAGSDPALQPVPVKDYPFTVDTAKKDIFVEAGSVEFQMPITYSQN